MKVWIKEQDFNAWKWICSGYANAWKYLGYDVCLYKNLSEINDYKSYALIMEFDIMNAKDVESISKIEKVFLFALPNVFPYKWGQHPNYISILNDEIINDINKMNNVRKWTFVDVKKEYYTKWKNVNTIPLAFDSISYKKEKEYNIQYDVCYVGGRANNGFDEKYNIMMKTFAAFVDSGLKCGFFVDRNLTHEQEKSILYGSKVLLNVHDAYQRELSLDTNERTFKSLGTCGILVSDKVGQIDRLELNVAMTNDPKETVELVKEYIKSDVLQNIRKENIQNVSEKHTYVNRVKELLKL